MSVVKLYDEVPLIIDLKNNTIQLIKATDVIEAIKRLVSAHDILALSLKIANDFRKEFIFDPVIDYCAMSDLATIRRELIVYYRLDFHPPKSLELYCDKMGKLFYLLTLMNKDFSVG